MIAHLSGTLTRMESTFVVLDVGGVGYKVSVPVSVLTTFTDGQAGIAAYPYARSGRRNQSLFGFAEANRPACF